MTVVHSDDWLTLHQGDCRAVMAELEPESINCVVTSPPYWGLRDYALPPSTWDDGWEGCLGLEPRPEMFVDHLVEVFRAIRRVLRKDGVVWLNIGDTYADRANKRSDKESFREDRADVVPGKRNSIGGEWRLKAKDRIGIPPRVAIALQADGWWWRDEVVWHKPNPMPSSVDDRTTPAHEMVYLLTKSARYAYDSVAIRELETGGAHPRGGRDVPAGWNHSGFEQGDGGGARTAANNPRVKVPGGWDVTQGDDRHGTIHREGRTTATYTDKRWPSGWANGEGRGHDPQIGRYDPPPAYEKEVPLGRNKRSVWTVSTQPYVDAHFATFPEKLIEPMIAAGCPPGGTVLDPFGGSGTTGIVAEALGRKAVLIELSTKYLGQALKRIAGARYDREGHTVDLPIDPPADGLWAGVG